jgi:hypothetical protein
VLTVSLDHSAAAKNANPTETGTRLHVLAPFGVEGVDVDVDEVLLDMTMTDGLTGIGIGIAQGAMRMTMVPDEVVAVGPTMTGSMVIGKAVTTMHPKAVIRCLLSSSSILSLLQLHL